MPVARDVQVAAARAEDLVVLAQTLATLPLLESYGQTPDKLLAAWQRAERNGETLLVAREGDGPALGLAWFAVRGGLGLAGYLRLLAIVPHAAGMKIGSVLLQAFEQATADARGGQLILCNSTNVAALAFYRRKGYASAGTLKAFAHPAQDEILLHKPAALGTSAGPPTSAPPC